MSTYNIKFVVQDDRDPQGFVEGAKVELFGEWLDVEFEQSTSSASYTTHHTLVQAKKNFSGDIKVTPIHTSGQWQGAGEARLYGCDDASGASATLIKAVSVAEDDTEVIFTEVTFAEDNYYIFEHDAIDDFRSPTTNRPEGEFINVLKSHIDGNYGSQASNLYGFAQYIFIGDGWQAENKNTDVNGEATFTRAPGDHLYEVSKNHYAAILDEATLVDQNIQEDITLASAKARVTSAGLQFDHAYTADRTLLRVTSVGLQVEVGEWYPAPRPIRTRPRIPASRTIPLNPASRTGTEPEYG